ncbi:hypothetical protein ACFSTC_56395 [Nonomuraea ferruginea]
MRRWTALATAVLIASLPFATSPAAAQAGAPDPARALKRQLVNKQGVRISETSRYFFGGKSTVSGNGTRIKGRLRLAPSGPAAADYTWWDLPSAKTKKKPELHRVIRVGADVYVDAEPVSRADPGGQGVDPIPLEAQGEHGPGHGSGREPAADQRVRPVHAEGRAEALGAQARLRRTPLLGRHELQGPAHDLQGRRHQLDLRAADQREEQGKDRLAPLDRP